MSKGRAISHINYKPSEKKKKICILKVIIVFTIKSLPAPSQLKLHTVYNVVTSRERNLYFTREELTIKLIVLL